MTASERYQWRRDRDGLGVWEHRGKVAVAGFRRLPGESMAPWAPAFAGVARFWV
jgi:hypothetical protein